MLLIRDSRAGRLVYIHIYSFSVQLEELLEPYLKGTDLGLPYWDWTKNSTVPDLWEDVYSPIKDYNNPHFDDYKKYADFTTCQNKFQGKCNLI